MVRIPQSQGHPLLVNTLRTRTRTAIFAFPPIAPSHRRFQIYSYDKRMSSPARGRFAMFARTCLQRERTRHGHTAPAYLLATVLMGAGCWWWYSTFRRFSNSVRARQSYPNDVVDLVRHAPIARRPSTVNGSPFYVRNQNVPGTKNARTLNATAISWRSGILQKAWPECVLRFSNAPRYVSILKITRQFVYRRRNAAVDTSTVSWHHFVIDVDYSRRRLS